MAMIGDDALFVQSTPWIILDDWWKYRNRPPVTEDLAPFLRARSETAAAVAPVAGTGATRHARAARRRPASASRPRRPTTSRRAGVEIELGRFFSDGEDRAAAAGRRDRGRRRRGAVPGRGPHRQGGPDRGAAVRGDRDARQARQIPRHGLGRQPGDRPARHVQAAVRQRRRPRHQGPPQARRRPGRRDRRADRADPDLARARRARRRRLLGQPPGPVPRPGPDDARRDLRRRPVPDGAGAAGRRDRRDEHHVRERQGADARDRRPQGARGDAAGHPVPVPGRGRRDLPRRRRDRGGAGRRSWPIGVEPGVHGRAVGRDGRAGVRDLRRRRRRVRARPGVAGRPARPIEALRYE